MDTKFRRLRADEIDVRVGQVTKSGNGVMLLLYKDARCDMAILDETVGPMNWKREHSRDNRNCTVSIWDEDKGQWVGKEDTGTESNTDAEKGLASDSFKRACVNWGIGRELYTAPTIMAWVSNGVELKNGKCYQSFTVERIGYSESGEIKDLSIKADNGRTVFSWSASNPSKQPKTQKEPDNATTAQAKLDKRVAQISSASGADAKTIKGAAVAAGCKSAEEALRWLDTAVAEGRFAQVQ